MCYFFNKFFGIVSILFQVLQQSYDSYQMNNMYAYLRTFHTFIASVRRWLPDDIKVDFNKEAKEATMRKSYVEILLDYKRTKEVAINLNSDSDSDDERALEEKFSDYSKFSR